MTIKPLLIATAAIAAIVVGSGATAQRGGGMVRADTNGDGRISRAEATAQAEARFAAMDADKDGVLTPDEMAGPGARMMGRRGTAPEGPMTREAFVAQAIERFARLDLNGDGEISSEELKTWMERARAARGVGGAMDPADAVVSDQPSPLTPDVPPVPLAPPPQPNSGQ